MEIRKPILQKDGLQKIENLKSSPVIEIGDAVIENGALNNLEIEEVTFNGVKAENILLSGTKIDEGFFIDSILNKCDFSGTVFKNISLERCEIHKSRLQGTQCMEAKLKDIVVKNSKCADSSFRFSKMKNVAFVDCDFSDADFQGAEMENVLFENCNLYSAHFFSTKLIDVDIVTSNIEGIKINKESFGKVSVNSSQALYLASIFGLNIKS